MFPLKNLAHEELSTLNTFDNSSRQGLFHFPNELNLIIIDNDLFYRRHDDKQIATQGSSAILNALK